MLVAGGTHWGAILAVGVPGAALIAGLLESLRRQIKGWRDENAQAMGELAGLVADFADEIDEHLNDQDHALATNSERIRVVEKAAGVPQGAPYAPPRRRYGRRRLRAIEAGFRPPVDRDED